MKGLYIWGGFLVVVILVLAAILYTPTTGDVIIETTEPVILGAYIDIPSPEARILIEENPDIIIIDVSPNYENGHLPGAIGYYVGDDSLANAISSLDPSAMYLVYCHFESASRRGAQMLVDAGFTNVYRLSDDYGGWVMRGYPIEY